MAKRIQLATICFVLLNQHLLLVVGKTSNMEVQESDNVDLHSDLEEYSWSVSIKITDNRNGKSSIVCGGAIISENTVISAAHCVHNKTNLQDFKIEIILPAFNQEIIVDQIKIHPDLDLDTKIHDVALLKTALSIIALEPRLKIGQLPATGYNLQVLADSSSPFNPTEEPCYIIRYSNNSTLIQLPVRLATEEECRVAFEQSKKSVILRSDQVCAMGPIYPRVTYGYSGSPLICKNKTIYGIVSHGFIEYLPDIYTKVSWYLPWIHSELNERLFSSDDDDGFGMLEYYGMIAVPIAFILWLVVVVIKFDVFRFLNTQIIHYTHSEFKCVYIKGNGCKVHGIPLDESTTTV